jgi:hypothetical protein
MLNVVFCIWCAEIIEEVKLVKRKRAAKKQEKIGEVVASVYYRGRQLMRDRFALLIAEGNKPGVPHTPLASACCCRGIVTIVITTTPNNASAATMAITVMDVVLVISLTSY